MNTNIIKRIGIITLILAVGVALVAFKVDAQDADEEQFIFTESGMIDEEGYYPDESFMPGEQTQAQQPEYVPGEILVKFKEGADPASVLQEVGISAESIDRIHSTAPAVARHKSNLLKEKKLEKDSSGWYWYRGKQYKEVAEVSEEELFDDAYEQMEPVEKSLYRSYKLMLADGQDVEEVVSMLGSDTNIEYAEPNYKYNTLVIPTDPRFNEQWGLHNTTQTGGTDDADIDAPEAWDIATGWEDIVIAIVDTGIDYNHEDLAENMLANPDEIPGNNIDDDGNGYIDDIYGYDFCNNDSNPFDDHGHGTHCAGIAGAVGNNGIGIAGVAWNCKIMALKFLSARGSGSCSDGVASIIYAVDNGADVISNSWGGGGYSQTLNDAIDYAHSQGAVLVAAAGNSNTSSIHYPAGYTNMISVAATNHDDQRASFSNYGNWVDVAAPGRNILATVPSSGSCGNRSGYRLLSGTSMACPYVAGLCALILSENPEYTPEEVKALMIANADPLTDTGLGAGRINVNNTIEAVISIENFRMDIENQQHIHGYVDITGTVIAHGGAYFDRYELSYAPQNNPEDDTVIMSSISQKQDEILGSLDTATIPDGRYILTLKMFTRNPDREFTSRKLVWLDNYNDPPSFAGLNDKGVVIGKTLEFQLPVRDEDNYVYRDEYVFRIEGRLPPGATFDTETGEFSWIPQDYDKGNYNVTFTLMAGPYTISESINIATVFIEETQITFWGPPPYYLNSGGNRNPAIYGDKIVWEKWVPSWRPRACCNIHMYDISTGVETQITSYDRGHVSGGTFGRACRPDIYEDKIVWQNETGNQKDIYMHDLSTGITTQITDDRRIDRDPAIYGDKIVWCAGYLNFEMNVYMYDISTGETQQITSGEGCRRYYPDIYEDKIVWQDKRSGNFDIYMYDLSTGEETMLPVDGQYRSVSQSNPAIYGDRVMFQDERARHYYRPSSQINYDIYMYDLSTGEEIQITTNWADQTGPAIYGDKILYQDSRDTADVNNRSYAVYMYDLLTGVETQISPPRGSDSWPFGIKNLDPAIYGDTIVWRANRFPAKDNTDIFMTVTYFGPQINSVSATTIAPGDTIAIHGGNFAYTKNERMYVEFPQGLRANVESWSNAEITCVVPEGAVSGELKVVTPGGESNGIRITVEAGANLPQPPQELTARLLDHTVGGWGRAIGLTWKAGIGPAVDNFLIMASIDGGILQEIENVSGDSRGHILEQAQEGRAYQFYIIAQNSRGQSGHSNAVRMNTPPFLPEIRTCDSIKESGELVSVTGRYFGQHNDICKIKLYPTTGNTPYVISPDTWRNINLVNCRATFYLPTDVPKGIYQLSVINSAGESNRLAIEVIAPYISSITSYAALGEVIIIRGENFGRRGLVIFHDNKRQSGNNIIGWSDTQIRCKVHPRTESGPVKIMTLPARQLSNSADLEIEAPEIVSITPSAALGEVITITGNRFGARKGQVIFYNNKPMGGNNIVSWSDTQIQCKVHIRAESGLVKIKTLPERQFSNEVNLNIATPEITSVTSPAALGEVITITGNRFGTRKGQVIFHNNKRQGAGQITSWSNTQIMCKVHNAAATGPVKIMTLPSRQLSNTVDFEVATPSIDSITPSAARGEVITLTGNRFGTRKGHVVFHNNKASAGARIVSWTNTEITCKVHPAAITGPVKIRTIPARQLSNTVNFALAPPQINSVSPTQGSFNTTITITGEHFGSFVRGCRITFTRGRGTVNAAGVNGRTWINNQIICKVPRAATTGNITVITPAGRDNRSFTVR